MLDDYDPDWPRQYAAAAAELHDASGGRWVVEHIGSTSIPGMAAKPIIDLAVRVTELDDVSRRLEPLGWTGVPAGPQTHLVLVRKDGPRRTHIAHFFTADQWDTCHQRIFRDWLLEHSDDRQRYVDVKREAAAVAIGGRDYTARKTAVIQEIVDRARAARGLPSVDVWDK